MGHGAPAYTDAGAALFEHAETLRCLGLSIRVKTGFLKGDPGTGNALGELLEGRVVMAPFLMAGGYYLVASRLLAD